MDQPAARFDRRRFLEATLAAGGGALAANWAAGWTSGSPASAATVRRAAAVDPAGSDLGAVEHVIFLMQENRSFDHYFGTYPGVRGFDDHPRRRLGAFSQPFPANTTRKPTGRQLPFHLDTATDIAECTHDLNHSWLPQHQCRNGGAMDAFVGVHTSPQNEGPENGVLTMGYYARADLPYYYALADAFTICDGYHCSVMGPTHPNRLMALSGTIDPDGAHGGPVLITNPLPEARFSVDWPTMPEVLEDAGVSWKVYTPPGDIYRVTDDQVLAFSDAILPYFSQYADPASNLYRKAFQPIYPDDFATDVARGTLPKVSWIVPPIGYDEHPPAPPALGEWLTDQVLKVLVAKPEVWSKTVLFLMYDENDGFFDHVPPPVPPPGTPGEYLTVDPLPATAETVAGPVGLGFRVPMLVLSPFSRGGYVCSETFDHTSQLRFLEQRFGVRAPNISAWRRRTVGDLTATLHMGHSDPSKPHLPPTSQDSMARVTALGCQPGDLTETRYDQPSYPLPAIQAMPTQEPGRPRRLPDRHTGT
ncbi:MAG TPA: alkaline phosphatase family protein [Acidimicrobiales bacterium]|jgi:phospholipase C|nr:alkaline phosphatase family protein [Acidimicrobiales bacterium]